MPDRIYVTYTPTTMPGTFHTAVHYERSDLSGRVTKHSVIQAFPEKIDQMGVPDKSLAEIAELIGNNDGWSRFGRIKADVREFNRNYDPLTPYEDIAEGNDLSENLARMKLFAEGVNRAGFVYRGDHQNSNTFASGALQAGGLPSATGVGRDPIGSAGGVTQLLCARFKRTFAASHRFRHGQRAKERQRAPEFVSG